MAIGSPPRIGTRIAGGDERTPSGAARKGKWRFYGFFLPAGKPGSNRSLRLQSCPGRAI